MDTLLVFTREPRPGKAGLFLCPPLDFEQAAFLCHAMLRDTLRAAREIPGLRIRIVVNPGNLMGFVEGDYQWEAPLGLTLGRRMARAFQSAFREPGRVLAVSAQAPLLGTGGLAQAFAALDQASACLVPAKDGGVCALGLSRWLPVFEGVVWEGRHAARQARERIQALGLRLKEFAPALLVDGSASLDSYIKEIKKAPEKAPLSHLVTQAILTRT